MGPYDLLRDAAIALDRIGVQYLVTGSMATTMFGDPRFTNDVDIVVDLKESDLNDFLGVFPMPDFYVSEEAARVAIRTKGQFNILHPDSGLKIDVIIPDNTAFNRSRLSRGFRANSSGYETMFASLEDVILKKLEYIERVNRKSICATSRE